MKTLRTPFFVGSQARAWLDQEGITATACLRGGANMAKNGTRKATLLTSRMFSTTSSLEPNI